MATVVDSLIVTLGLDPAGFTKGRKQAVQDLVDTRTQANRIAKDVESSGKRAASFFSQVRSQALMLFAAFTAGKSIKQFVADLTTTNAGLGRMAVVAGTTTEALSRWRGIAAATGGSADGVASSINGLNQSLVKLSLTGESEIIPYFRALQAAAPQANLSLEGANGNMKTAIELLPELHKAVQGMDAARATAILTGMGLGQDMINILISSDKAFNKFMADQQRWGLVTKEQAAAAARLQYTNAGVIQSFETLGRVFLTKMEPTLQRVNAELMKLIEWFKENPKAVEVAVLGIGAAMTVLAALIGGPIGAVAALAVGFGVLYADWKEWNETGASAFGTFWQFVSDGWKDIATEVTNASRGFQEWVDKTTGFDGTHLAEQLGYIADEDKRTTDQMKSDWDGWSSSMKRSWTDWWESAGTIIQNAGPKIYLAVKKVFGDAFGWAVERANKVWRALTGHDLVGGDSETSEADKAAAAGGGVTRVGKPSPATREQQENDIQRLVGKGWTREQAAGIVANIQAESGGDHTIPGDGGQAYGLAQWHPDRQANFKRVFGKDIRSSTHDEQVDFFDWELRNTHKAAGDRLARSTSASDAAKVVMNQHEMPAERAMNGSVRSSIANNLMTPPPVSTTPVPAGATAVAAANGPRQAAAGGQTTIEIGQIDIHTQATDAEGISTSLKSNLEEHLNTVQANYGQI